MSVSFLSLAVVTVVAVAFLDGQIRSAAFFVGNSALLLSVFLGLKGTVSVLIFVVLGWVVVRSATRFPKWGLFVAAGLLVALFAWMHDYQLLHLILPDAARSSLLATAGLSFLLFKILHVAIEAKSGTLGPITFPLYLNYCVNFTTFLMGPIQRFQDYRSQWSGQSAAPPETLEAHLDAVNRILFGLFRVYVLGALVQPFMMTYQAGTENASFGSMLLQVYAFYFFLYFNFAGYCDIVIGLGSLMGIRPPENFNMPFLARNISDFWQRQHRSLTLWLTDYVFTPTLKRLLRDGWFRRRRTFAVAAALMLTMGVSGLWHGTTGGFLLFGLAHGMFLVLYHLWDACLLSLLGRKRLTAFRRNPLVALGGILITFNATAFAFVFFQLGAPKGLLLFANLLNP